MELFAIIANIDGVTEKGRRVVEIFLRQQVTLDAVEKYLQLFDYYGQKHSEQINPETKRKKRTPVRDSVKALVICTQINAELTQKQKIVVLIRLLEFINADKIPSDAEYDFISTVALAFNIEESEYILIKDYVVKPDTYEVNSPDMLIIDNSGGLVNKQTKHISIESLNNQLFFLRIKSVDLYVVKFKGGEELYLNGLAIKERQIYLFANGSTIRNPKISPIYYSDIIAHYMSDVSRARIVFKSTDLEFRFKAGKAGLHNINIAEESGKLIGLMGASGAGKTTCLNVLSGIEKPFSGVVTVNGIDIHKDSKKIEGVIGYISQDDLLIEELSVYQNLFYNAKLCFGNLSDEEIDKLVFKVLANLGLAEIKDITVGSPLNKKISGGQRKRLNIALELIREPSVLFVDEPTSGLSSRDSENVMDLLKELSLKGKLIFVVIHQPSSDIYKMFDKLFILDTGGYPIFYGNPIEAILYFKRLTNQVNADKSECLECGNVTPEQIFNIVETKVVDEYGQFTSKRKISPIQWHEFYKANVSLPHVRVISEVPKSTLSVPNKFRQLGVFITRDVLSKLSNMQYMVINFTEAPALALILAFLVRYYSTDENTGNHGYFFSENMNVFSYLFMSIVVSLFMGLTVSAEEIIKDRKIQKRESFLNLSRTSYLFSKIITLFIISAIQMFTFVFLANWILDIRDMTLSYWLVLFSTACFANMLGLNISATFNSAVTIYILIPILLIPQLLLSGAIVKFDRLNPNFSSDIHVPLTGDLMVSKWAFEALLVNQFKNNKYEKPLFRYDKEMSNSDFKKNYLLPELESKIDYCEANYQSQNDSVRAMVSKNLNLLKNEFTLLNRVQKTEKFANPTVLNIKTYNRDVADSARMFIQMLKKYYIKKSNWANDTKDKYVTALQADDKKHREYVELKKRYFNDFLDNEVRNSRSEQRIVEREGNLIQKIDPIYLDPIHYVNKFDFRAHLYAPNKHFMGSFYDTFGFNLVIIWAMSFILYFTLYFDMLSKFINLFIFISEAVKDRFKPRANTPALMF